MTAQSPAGARLMLLDTYGLVYAAFFAMKDRPLTTSRGTRIEAAYVFTTTLTKLIADERPTHVVACFDKGLPAARVAIFRAYKAQREAMPDDLRSQFALVRRILEVYDIPALEIEGEEADDVIATLARQAEEQHQATIVVTGDHDLLQIVDDRTTVLLRTRLGSGITPLRSRRRAGALRARAAPAARLPGAQGRSVRQPARHPGHRREDRDQADQGCGFARRAAGRTRRWRERRSWRRSCASTARWRGAAATSRSWSATSTSTSRGTRPATSRRRRKELFPLYRDLEFKSLLAKLPAPSNDAPLFSVDAADRLRGAYRSFVPSVDPPEFELWLRWLREAAGAQRAAVALRGDGDVGVSVRPKPGFRSPPPLWTGRPSPPRLPNCSTGAFRSRCTTGRASRASCAGAACRPPRTPHSPTIR